MIDKLKKLTADQIATNAGIFVGLVLILVHIGLVVAVLMGCINDGGVAVHIR